MEHTVENVKKELILADIPDADTMADPFADMSGQTDKPADPFADLSEDEFARLMAMGKQVIKQRHIETLQHMAAKDGVTTVQMNNEGTRLPWRPKIVIYAMRIAQGETVENSRYVRMSTKRGGKKKRVLVVGAPATKEKPLVERVKLAVVTDNRTRSAEDDFFKSMTLRASAAKVILEQLLEGLQEHKAITDEQIERINTVPETEGDQETTTAEVVSGGTDAPVVVREEAEDAVNAGSQPADGDAREQS